MTTEKIGIALGSGAARGWAHIGVLREFAERGVHFDIVCGSSIGALVGAAYASEQLGVLEDWVRGLERLHVLRLLDASVRSGGVFLGARVFRAIRDRLQDLDIDALPRAFAAVATDLYSGQEVWLREGPMLNAARASSGIPGLLAPVLWKRRWLVDGGVVNPVPVSLCRALGADRVVAVNLNADLLRTPPSTIPGETEGDGLDASHDSSDLGADASEAGASEAGALERVSRWIGTLASSLLPEKRVGPGLFEVMGSSVNIMQDRITRSRMVGDPPELLIEPRLGHLELLDFHRAEEAIEAGRESVRLENAHLGRIGIGHSPRAGSSRR